MPCFHTILAVLVVAPASAFKFLSGNAAASSWDACIPNGGTNGTNCFQDPSDKASCDELLNCAWDPVNTYCRPNHRCIEITDKAECENITGGHCSWWAPVADGAEVADGDLSANRLCIPQSVVPCDDNETFPDQDSCEAEINCAWHVNSSSCQASSRCPRQSSYAACTSKDECFWWDASYEN